MRSELPSRSPTVVLIWASAIRRGRASEVSTAIIVNSLVTIGGGMQGGPSAGLLARQGAQRRLRRTMEPVKVTILPGRDTHEVEARTVAELLQELHIHQDACLVLRQDQILTRDVRLSGTDELEVWPVISGGSTL
jgi:sulfur carrier protein ThiS